MTQQPKNNRHGGARLDTTRPTSGAARTQQKKEKRIMIVMIILAVLMALAATISVLLMRWVRKPTLPSAGQPSAPLISGSTVQPDPDSGETPYVLDFDPVEPKVGGERKSEDFYTILVFGADMTSGLTDTIMLVSYDVTNQKATVMSIPRDTQVNVRTKWSKSINAVYYANGQGEKGIRALRNEVSELVGFDPDYCIMIDWALVGKMVDAIGGVWFDIPYHMDYDDWVQDLYIHFDPGYQYLNGDDAMKVVRWRKNNKKSPYYGEGGGSDTGRLKVQHDFLKAVLKQTLQLTNVTRIGELSKLFGENVVSDLTIENLFWFASKAILGGLNVDDVNFTTMPYYGSGTGLYKNKVFPSQKALLKLINESLNPFVEDVTIRQLDLMRVSSDGNTMSSSTGRLADPSVAIPPSASPSPGDDEDDDPLVSGEPFESGEPGESGTPGESGAPTESGTPGESGLPVESQTPGESGAPVESGNPVSSLEPPPSQDPPQPSPEPSPIQTVQPEPSPDVPDWLQPDPGA